MAVKVRKVKRIYYFPQKQIEREYWEVIENEKIELYDNFKSVLRRIFKNHGNLYREISNIPSEIEDEFHPDQDDFSKDCMGFRKFIEYFFGEGITSQEAYQRINDIFVSGEKILIKTETKIISEFDVD